MTIAQALDRVDQQKPNMISRDLKISFLNEIDQMIHEELVLTHVHSLAEEAKPQYDRDTDPGTELIMPSPYDKLYEYWLMHRIDHINMEIDKENNDRMLFDNAYEEASDWWTRKRMPIQRTREFRL